MPMRRVLPRCGWARVADAAEPCCVVTLGTGIGSALFVDGRLVPNTELGHLQVGSEEAEQRASARVRVERGLSWQDWAAEVNVVLAEMHRLLWPDLFIIGGGVTENWDQFGPLLSKPAEIVVARYGNDAGLIGAAMAAVESGLAHRPARECAAPVRRTRPNCPMSARPSLR